MSASPSEAVSFNPGSFPAFLFGRGSCLLSGRLSGKENESRKYSRNAPCERIDPGSNSACNPVPFLRDSVIWDMDQSSCSAAYDRCCDLRSPWNVLSLICIPCRRAPFWRSPQYILDLRKGRKPVFKPAPCQTYMGKARLLADRRGLHRNPCSCLFVY